MPKPPSSFTITRSLWDRGIHAQMLASDGRRSLMGFYAEAHGIPDSELALVCPMALYVLHKRQLAHMIRTDHLDHIDDSELAVELMAIESDEGLDEGTREGLIELLFSSVCVEVTFR